MKDIQELKKGMFNTMKINLYKQYKDNHIVVKNMAKTLEVTRGLIYHYKDRLDLNFIGINEYIMNENKKFINHLTKM